MLPTESRVAANKSDSNASRKEGSHFTAPIAAIFALGCLIIIAAFTAVSTFSGIKFSQNVKGAVDDNLALALRGAIQAIQSPLEESQRYIDRLQIKIRNNPEIYGIDDEIPSSFAASSGFYTDAMLAAYQRPEISSIFQLRRSTRYEHSPGSPVDTLTVVNMPRFAISRMSNNTLTSLHLTSLKALASLPLVGFPSFPVNISGTPFMEDAYSTVGSRWVVGVLSVPASVTSTRMSIYSQVNNSASSWAIGVEHNMTVFRDLMKQATAPFSIGITNPSKTVASGAHTSLYDLNGGVLMSTSITSFELFKSSTDLWPAGSTPSSDINAAYNSAIAACPPSSTACTTIPALLEVDGNLIGAMRLVKETSGLDLLLVSSVPRKHFFGEADKSLAVSIGVAVACCVVIVAGCIAVLMAIGPALRHLQENMMLASVLQNHLVEHTPSRLTDIAKLSAVFDEMNQRLLIARSFVPEAVLLGEEDADDDEEEDIEIESHAGTNTHKNSNVKSVGSSRSSVFGATKLRGVLNDSSHGSTSTAAVHTPHHGSRLFTMNEKRVAVLSLNMVGFSGLVGGSNPSRVNDVSSKLLSIVVQAAQRERGVMDSFHGDHFLLTFNASRPVASSLAAAIRTANAVAEDVCRDARLRGCMGVAAGAAIGKALVGTLGIDGHRRLSIVGSVYRQAIALQAVSSQLIQKTTANQGGYDMTGCVIEESALREIGECGMYMQLIGRAVPPMGARNQTVRPVYAAHGHKFAVRRHSNTENGVHTDNKNKSTTADEWLYELDAIHAGDPFTDPNAALKALMSGNTEACNQMLIANDCGAPQVSVQQMNGDIRSSLVDMSGDLNSGTSDIFTDATSIHSSGFANTPKNNNKNIFNQVGGGTTNKVGWGPVEALFGLYIKAEQQHHEATNTTTNTNQNVWDHLMY